MSTEFTFEELAKQPVTKLREIALSLEVIQGVHGMNKNEVLAAICELKGIEDPHKKEAERKKAAAQASIKELKEKRRALQKQFDEKKDSLRKDEKKAIRKAMTTLRRNTRELASV